MQGNYAPRIPAGSSYLWTAHAQAKMHFYGLSESRVRRVLHSPLRIEEGIAPGTVAALQPTSYKTKEGKRLWGQEIWVMYKITNNKQQTMGGALDGKRETEKSAEKGEEKKDDKARAWIASMRRALTGERKVKIISAWRYPGVTKPGAPLPQAIADEIEEAAGVW
ncbi:MAG: hypothetical protein WC246_03565 [Candidatus Paceibacterota bacterium]|jgi:hypothetical protein